MKTIQIKDKTYNIAYNLRGLFTYEELAGHPYSGQKTIDTYLLLYSMIMANNAGFDLEFEQFIDECDNDPSIYKTFLSVVDEMNKKVSMLADNDKKKAVSQ